MSCLFTYSISVTLLPFLLMPVFMGSPLSCPSGTYGRQCESLCHCAENVTCDRTTGRCPGECADRWFGYACQDQIAWVTTTNKSQSWAVDNNDETCNNNKETVIRLKLANPQRLAWLRLVFIDGMSGFSYGDMTIRYDEIEGHMNQCPWQQYMQVNKRTLDIHCQTPGVVVQLELVGYLIGQLCSVYVPSECPLGKYGRNCVETCGDHCRGQYGECAYPEGACIFGCELGYQPPSCLEECQAGQYGPDCDQQCSDHCAGPDHECNITDGSCIFGCGPGYQSPLCLEECPVGQYGPDCNQQCSDHCAEPDHRCNSTDGSCTFGCNPGYLPPLCLEECPAGQYGPGCLQQCSDHCAGPDHQCNSTDGSCIFGCGPGYQSPLCVQACALGQFGSNCSNTCSLHCAGTNSTCSPVDGSCHLGCIPGYLPPLCLAEAVDQPENDRRNVAGPLGLLLMTLIFVIGIAAAVLISKHGRKKR